MFGLDLISVLVGAGLMLLLGVVAPKLVAKLTKKTGNVVDEAKSAALQAVKNAAANGASTIVADVVKKV